jgi:hypothetical protein
MPKIVSLLTTHRRWLFLSVVEPLVILLVIFLFERDYFSEFETKAGFEVLGIGASFQLIGVCFVIPYAEIKPKSGIRNWLLKALFVLLAVFCIVSANAIYSLGPEYLITAEARYMR